MRYEGAGRSIVLGPRIATEQHPRPPARSFRAAGATYVIPPEYVFPLNDDETARAAAVALRSTRRRAQTKGPRYSLAAVAARDGYVCHLCGMGVDMSLSGRDPMGPTADHLLPVAHGGGDEEANIALAHSRCNIKRGTKPLRLVG